MGHIALYRKYRPQRFDQIIGQEHVTDILKRQIELQKVSHAYIFSGTRGTGKTTAAKIFARAINCKNLNDGEPCNECESCRAILDGSSTDVEELDAASNNSVENIRSIRQEVAYIPTNAKYKVYIIDEAHMLTKSAFNALLKTLEEPPQNVVFILATTEEYKLLPTIKSRCLRFEFKKLDVADIEQGIKKVLEDLQVDYDEEAVKYIAKVADGALRDALSILERCLSNETKQLTLDSVQKILGMVDVVTIRNLMEAILNYDAISTYKWINEILESGKDIRYVSGCINEEMMKVLVYLASNKTSELDKQLIESANKSSIERINHCISTISRLDDKLRQTTNSSSTFTACMMELATEVIVPENGLRDKIKELELKVEKMEKNGIKTIVNNAIVDKEIISDKLKKEVIKTSDKILPFKEIEQIAKLAADRDNLKLFSALAGAKGSYRDDETIIITTQNSFAYGLLKKEDNLKSLKELITEVTAKTLNVELEYIEDKKVSTNKFEQMMRDTGVPFTVED